MLPVSNVVGDTAIELRDKIAAHFGATLALAPNGLEPNRRTYDIMGTTGRRIVQVTIFWTKRDRWQIGGWTCNPDISTLMQTIA